MNSGTVDGTSVPALADFTYCNLHFACFLVTISSGQTETNGEDSKDQEHVSREGAEERGTEKDEHTKSENPIFGQELVPIEN